MSFRKNSVWRFIDSGPASGAFNMAADCVMATRMETDVPILRVYRWHPSTISLGFHQKISDLNQSKCETKGIDIVRRPTGGRAILHANEVTYCVIIPGSHSLFSKNTIEVYNEISSAIVKGLNQLDLNLMLTNTETASPNFSDYNKKFACFATSARYEIHYKSKKVVGSAQRRYDNALLQHGSIILGDEHLKLVDYLAQNDKTEIASILEQLNKRTTSLSAILQKEVKDSDVIANLKRGFESHFGIKFETNLFSRDELDLINQQIPEYSN